MQNSVKASVNYTVDNGTPPDYYFYEPDPSVKLNPPGTDPREVEISTAGRRSTSSQSIARASS